MTSIELYVDRRELRYPCEPPYHLEVERAIGKFYLFAETAQREEWFERANTYIDSRMRWQEE